MTNTIGLFFAVLASLQSGAGLPDVFASRKAVEVLFSSSDFVEAEHCIISSGVSACPVRMGRDRDETVFFLTLQTLSGRNPPAWRLVATETGSSIEIYDGRRYFRKARKCFRLNNAD